MTKVQQLLILIYETSV